MISKYLARFTELASKGEALHELVGDILLVERITGEHKTASGLVLAEDPRQRGGLQAGKPQFVIVLAVGKGWYNEESGKEIPLDVKPGDVILIGEASVKYFSMFGGLQGYEADQIGITRESEIQLRFKGTEAYEQSFKILNGST
jgi:co-chaperonin GroES (HSP10)